MKTPFRRIATVTFLLSVGMAEVVWATCGGGGGGGGGGSGGGSNDQQIYPVPWKNVKLEDPATPGGLFVYWFPASQNELEKSSLRNSRLLALYASQCVTMGVSDSHAPLGRKLVPEDTLPVAILAAADGTIIGKAQAEKGMLQVAQVEKLLATEMKQREAALKDKIKMAKAIAKQGDKDAAAQSYREVLEQKCLFPKLAKDAVSGLKKLGVAVETAGPVFPAPNFDAALSARIERTMRQGLVAENLENFSEAKRLYSAAQRLDPADPAPLRYLGELYRHHIGDWVKARQTFNELLVMPADPLSRAVALHGLGKMTIHEGAFKKGLGLMEDSVKEFPLALAYRNLAVYWNSEGDLAKADGYTRQALALNPTDSYNLIFSAVYLAANGHGDEALAVAREHESQLDASYNLAAIYAQIGQKDKALALLRRHFFEYERTQSVRSKEMMEARVDAMFASLHRDSGFIALTSGADGKLPMPGMAGMNTGGSATTP